MCLRVSDLYSVVVHGRLFESVWQGCSQGAVRSFRMTLLSSKL